VDLGGLNRERQRDEAGQGHDGSFHGILPLSGKIDRRVGRCQGGLVFRYNKPERGLPMKTILTVVGALLILLGGVWILQGINVLPGSFMTGQIRWAIYGGIAAIVGLLLIVRVQRKKASVRPKS
jgi:hypothetical protein